jgi:hypothetical protein
MFGQRWLNLSSAKERAKHELALSSSFWLVPICDGMGEALYELVTFLSEFCQSHRLLKVDQVDQ